MIILGPFMVLLYHHYRAGDGFRLRGYFGRLGLGIVVYEKKSLNHPPRLSTNDAQRRHGKPCGTAGLRIQCLGFRVV